MTKVTTKTILAATGTLALLSLPNLAQATENGSPTTAAGVYDFGAGIMPRPSDIGAFGLRAAYYSTDASKDDKGNTNPGDFSLNVLSIAVAYYRMTNYELFGAKYGFGTIVPFFRMRSSINVGPFSNSADVTKQADLQFTPIVLQWDLSPQLFMNAQLQFQAPTGDYDQSRMVSPGLNHWTMSPIYNISYITDTGLELSSSFELDINAKNPDTNYKSGIEYRHEFAIGQHVKAWTFGLGGYYYKQITDDSGDGATSGNRAQAIALGPVINYFKPGMPIVGFHAYKEFSAKNRTEGYNVAVRVSKSF